MSRNNTGNPIGSTDYRDLQDNMRIADDFVNSATGQVVDRLGVTRRTIAGMESAFDSRIASLGYDLSLGDYGAGKTITDRGQVVLRDGEYYKAAASATLPLVLTGAWGTDSAKLVAVGDAALRQELAAGDGAEKVGYQVTGGVVRDVAGKLGEFVSVLDFIPESEHAAIRAGTSTYDCTAGIQAAITATGITGGAVFFPAGVYKVTDVLEINDSNVTIYGCGDASVIKAYNSVGSNNWTQLGVIAVNVRRFYVHASDRISGICIRDIVVDQSSVTTGYFIQPLTRRLMAAAVGARFVDRIQIRNLKILDCLHSGISLRGCFDQIIDGCSVIGMRSVRVHGGVFGGNAIEMGAWYDGETRTYTGPYGCGKITKNTVIGSTRTAFPDTVVDNHLDTCNIGIQTEVGALNPISRQVQQIITANNTVMRCQYGIVIEGQTQGGAGAAIATSNDVQECIHGIWFFGNSGMSGSPVTVNNAYSVVLSSNRISNTYAIPISINGNNFAVTGNVITDWAIAPNASPFTNYTFTEAPGIRAVPVASGDVTTTLAKGGIIANNILENRYVNNSTYRWPVTGILAVAGNTSSAVWENLIIQGNLLNGGQASGGSSSFHSGVSLVGRVDRCMIHANEITGFPRRGIFVAPFYSSARTTAASHLTITNNKIIDNGFAYVSAGPAISLETQNSHYYICNNEVIETFGTRMFAFVSIPQDGGVDSATNEVTIRGNKIRGMQFGNINVIELRISGTNVRLENNEDYNYRTSIPTASAQYIAFRGTVVHNTQPSASGFAGWVCTTGGGTGAVWKTFGAISA